MVKISIRFVNNTVQDFERNDSIVSRLRALRREGYAGKALVHELLTDDWGGAPPAFIDITGRLADGSVVDETIAYE